MPWFFMKTVNVTLKVSAKVSKYVGNEIKMSPSKLNVC